MKNLDKLAKMAKLAFLNGIRLHKDSILLYKKGSIPSSFHLSVLSQEEIGKAFILEEIVFQTAVNEGIAPEFESMLLQSLLSHTIKQGWFSRQADDFFKYKTKRFSKFIKETEEGKLEERKQNAMYVGLTKKGKKIDIKGKITNPIIKVRKEDTKGHITRVNDYIIDLIEGCRRGQYTVDTEDMDSVLTMDLVEELESLWSEKSKDSIARLNKLRKIKIDNDH